MHNLFYRNSDEKSLKHGLLLFKVWKVNLTVRVICNAIFAFLLSSYLTALNEAYERQWMVENCRCNRLRQHFVVFIYHLLFTQL